MATIGTLSYKIIANTQSFSRGMTLTRKELRTSQQLLNSSRSYTQKYSDRIAELNALVTKGAISFRLYRKGIADARREFTASIPVIGRFLNSISLLRGALAGVAAVVAAGVWGVKLSAQAEQARVGFETMLGSAEKANRMMEDLKQFAAATPFERMELTDAARQLIAFGVAQEQLIPTLRQVGDVASGISAPIGEIAEIYGKAKVQGRLFAEDINQLTGRGIPIMEELADQFDITTDRVKKLVESGQVGFENLAVAFANMTGEGGRFHQMMQRQSETTGGRWSTLGDNFKGVFETIGSWLKPIADLAIDVSNSALESTQSALNWAMQIDATSEAIEGNTQVIEDNIDAQRRMAQQARETAEANNKLRDAAAELGDRLTESVESPLDRYRNALGQIDALTDEITDTTRFRALEKAGEDLAKALGVTFEKTPLEEFRDQLESIATLAELGIGTVAERMAAARKAALEFGEAMGFGGTEDEKIARSVALSPLLTARSQAAFQHDVESLTGRTDSDSIAKKTLEVEEKEKEILEKVEGHLSSIKEKTPTLREVTF